MEKYRTVKAKRSATSFMGEGLTTEMTSHRQSERLRECGKVYDDGCVHGSLRFFHQVSAVLYLSSPDGPCNSSQAQSAVVLPAL
jgi:hypothetical protein